MALDTSSSAILGFGVFEVDLRAGELRKRGKRIKLQDQPFQVLSVLLRQSGNVVTREELRTQIWPGDTFVDFDNSLNTAINKLREALGDSADSPRFIETLPRRGYRFLAPVSGSDLKKQVVQSGRWKTAVTVMIVIVVVAAVAVGWFWRSRHGSVLTERDTIVLGDFTNSTGDSVFDGTLREGLSVQLQQSPFLSLVSDEGIHQTLRMMGQSANARLTPEITREVCQRTNGAAALDGSIALIGTRYNLILKAVSCANGEVLASMEAQVNDKSHVLDALSTTASEMRTKLGESLTTVQKYNTPVEQATTPSLEALQAYSLGFRTLGAGDTSAALALFQQATRLDPKFSMAYWGMNLAYANLGESLLTVENSKRAFDLRETLSEREKLTVECDHQPWDVMAAIRSCKLGAQIFPREPFFRLDLGVYANLLGRYDEGLREYQEAVRLAPSTAFLYRNVVYTLLLLDRADEAAKFALQAQSRGADSDFLVPVQYGIAFFRKDAVGMRQEAARGAGRPEVEDLLLALEADTAAYSGRLGRARELSRQAAESAYRKGQKETAAGYQAVSALREALFGDGDQARERAATAKKHGPGRELDYALALSSAYARDAGAAQTFVNDLVRRFADDTTVQLNYVPTLHAKLALLRANPEQAIEMLRMASPYEFGLCAIGFYNWPNLYPVYVRGEAYLAARRGKDAAAEFQKILDHRGIVLNEPIGALAHLQLGRAYAMAGDTPKARAAYQDFLNLWKDADPDIPILLLAKAEYAKLN